MYRQVQHFGDGVYYRADGSTVNVPAVIEDEDNLRMLVIADAVPIEVWKAAHALGVAGLLKITDEGLLFVTADRFAEKKTTTANLFDLPDRHWVRAEPGVPVWRLVDAWTTRHQGGNDFVHLHTHSEFSQLDGLSTMDEIGAAVVADGQSAVAITDHGTCAGHPALQKMATDFGIKAIFGIECNFVDDRFAREDQYDYRHLVLYAKDDQGLKNLWGLSTEGYRDGFYGRPRIDWSTLARFHEGLIASSACLRGPLLEPFGRNDEQSALRNLARLGDIFGEDLYIELHTNRLPQQVTGNHWLAEVSRRYHVPVIAAVDAHYARREDGAAHDVWMAVATNKDVTDDKEMFTGEKDYFLMGSDEVRASLSYLGEIADTAIATTAVLAAQCSAEIKSKVVKPVFSRPTAEHPDPVRHDTERFVDGALAAWNRRITARELDPAPYLERWQAEGPLLIDKQYCGYYLICADFVGWAKEHGILVGPGRGSGVASLFAYLHGITEIDPVEGELNLDRFMTPGRKSLPDFDIDFPSTRADEVIAYVQTRWGHEHVARVGSHMRLQSKGCFKGVQTALASKLPPESYGWVVTINKLIDAAEATTAGLGLSWEELMNQIGDVLAPVKEQAPELFHYAELFHNRLRTYGSHAAGFIIDPDSDLEAELPMRNSGDGGPMVTQWDMDALEYVGKVKFDLLRLRNLDTVQDAIDLIKAETDYVVNPYEWHEEYDDPQVYAELAEGRTLGVFQIETALGTRTTRQLVPSNRFQLSDVITIGRPGPLRSGLDRIYLRRRIGEEAVELPDPRLKPVLAKTFGVMLYQEDIMSICRVLADYDADEADNVRRILGKKKIELVDEEGRRFVEHAVAFSTDRSVAVNLWAQMAEFAKYSFNRAHAYSYATLALWTAWLKTHYPRQFLTAVMATVKKERVREFVTEARRLGYEVLPPDVNDSREGFFARGLVIRYGLKSIPGVGDAATNAILAGQPYIDYDDFLARKGAANMGIVRKLVEIGAFDSLHPNRHALEARLIDDVTGVSEQCVFKTDGVLNEHNLPCTFDWDSEPKNYGRTGKLLKTQLKPPKRCTKACRHYTRPEPKDYSGLPNYSDEEIRDREIGMLGVYLSSSPFDPIPADTMAKLYTAEELMLLPRGIYPVAAIVTAARNDPKGRDFGFVTFATPSGDLSVIVWAKLWAEIRPVLRKGSLVFITVEKSGEDRYRLESVKEPPRRKEASNAQQIWTVG